MRAPPQDLADVTLVSEDTDEEDEEDEKYKEDEEDYGDGDCRWILDMSGDKSYLMNNV